MVRQRKGAGNDRQRPAKSRRLKSSPSPKTKPTSNGAPAEPQSELTAGDVQLVPLADIKPSPENDKLYRPTDARDSDLQGLADSIRRLGVRVPLSITRDNFIISGHRRYAAAKIAGLTEVPCKREGIFHSDPNFLVFLRECNRQRVKSAGEVLREEIVSATADPSESYARLIRHRRDAARVKVETRAIEGVKHRAEISDAKHPLLNAIKAVIERLEDFWPLSDRQIHYQLLNNPPLIHAAKPGSRYRNDLKSYKALTELLTRARIAGFISFNVIHDPTRPVRTWAAFESLGAFYRSELENFLDGYYRDLQQSQPNHIEIVGEKNTIEGIIRPVAAQYTIPYTLARGYSSLPPRNAIFDRFTWSGKESLVLIVVSDFDPEGEDIPESFARSMRDDFGIEDVELVKAALTREQVERLQLPPGLKAKKGSSRRRRFVERHGEHVHELEAVEPEELQRILRETIEGVLDMDLFHGEQEAERHDATGLEAARNKISDTLLSSLDLDDDE